MSTLPAAIAAYYGASENGDIGAIVACFADDAVVIDENRTWRGRDEIREWREFVAGAYTFTTEVRGTKALTPSDGLTRYEVRVHLKGDFPGGEVDLTNRFGLRGALIESLNTA